MPGIKRRQLQFHTENECPLRVVSCDYEPIGCDENLLFKDRVKHNENCLQEHLYLMSAKLLYVSNENDALRSLCLSLESNFVKMQEQYDVLLSLFNEKTAPSGVVQNGQEDVFDKNADDTQQSPKGDRSYKAPMLPPRTPSMIKLSDSPHLSQGEVESLLKPTSASENRRTGVIANSHDPSPISTNSDYAKSPTSTNSSSRKNIKHSHSMSDDASSEDGEIKRRPLPPLPVRHNSLSADTLPQKKELRQQLQLFKRNKKVQQAAARPLPSLKSRSERSVASSLPSQAENGDKQPAVNVPITCNRSLPNLIDIVEENASDGEESDLPIDSNHNSR